MAKKSAKAVKKAVVKKTAKVAAKVTKAKTKAKPKAKATVKTVAKPAVKKSTGSKNIVVSLNQLYELVEKRAYEMFLERGCSDGGHQGDWYLAEKELRSRVTIKNN